MTRIGVGFYSLLSRPFWDLANEVVHVAITSNTAATSTGILLSSGSHQGYIMPQRNRLAVLFSSLLHTVLESISAPQFRGLHTHPSPSLRPRTSASSGGRICLMVAPHTRCQRFHQLDIVSGLNSRLFHCLTNLCAHARVCVWWASQLASASAARLTSLTLASLTLSGALTPASSPASASVRSSCTRTNPFDCTCRPAFEFGVEMW